MTTIPNNKQVPFQESAVPPKSSGDQVRLHHQKSPPEIKDRVEWSSDGGRQEFQETSSLERRLRDSALRNGRRGGTLAVGNHSGGTKFGSPPRPGQITTVNSDGLGSSWGSYQGMNTDGLRESARKAGYAESDLTLHDGSGSSYELIKGVNETSDLFLFFGHNYNRPDGTGADVAGLKMSDRSIMIRSLLEGKSFDKLPQVLAFSACNSASMAPDFPKDGKNAFVGFDGFINGNASAAFSKGFYDSLVEGRTVEEAVEAGVRSVENSPIPSVGCHGRAMRDQVRIIGNGSVTISP